ncbi:MAG: hypothetical protein IT357_11250 [Gemmatimonadaceae bacterium]|nr:hypothetical protein [Gemmatimonadaceae bacterium]
MLALGAAALGAAGGAALVMAGSSALIAASTAAPIVGPGTLKLIDALHKAGPGMDARVSALSKWLPSGQKAIRTTLEGGAQMFTGGAGKNARQVIMNADGSTVINAFNVAKKTFEHVTTITPKVP